MKFQIFSDLHLESFKKETDIICFLESLATNTDYILVAGDITNSKNIIKHYNLLVEILGDKLIFIAGNHEYYGSTKHKTDNDLKQIKGTFLNNSFIELDDNIVVIGGTGWHQSINSSYMLLNDYHKILDLRLDKRNSYFWHNYTYEYFDMIMNMFYNKGKKIICLTHNAPLCVCTPDKYKGDRLNIYFVNDWSDLFKYDPVLWVYGHIHYSNDFIYNNTRIIENDFGYKNINENPKFLKNLVVKI